MKTDKGRGRSRKREFNSIRRVTDKLKRFAVWLVCISLIGTNIPVSMIIASAEEGDDMISGCEIFSMSLDSLLGSADRAVTYEEPLSEDICEFSGSAAGTCERLFSTDNLYEIYPETDVEGEDLDLRTFVRVNGSAYASGNEENEERSLSYYNVTGDDEIIFLLINDTDSEISARIQVSTDEETYETQLIKVPGNHESIVLEEEPLSTPLEYVTIDEKEENVQTAALRTESGSDAFPEEKEKPENGEDSETRQEAEPGTEAEAETENGAEPVKESVSAETGSAGAGSSKAVVEAIETASNALVNASSHSEGCVSMHGTLYDAVIVDAGHAVAFSTTFADLGYGSNDIDDTEWVTYTAYADGVAVTVKLPAGAVPEDAELAVTRHDENSSEYIEALSLINEYKEDSSEYEQAVAALSLKDSDRKAESSFTFSAGDKEETESGMISLDISFLVDGEEIEPEAEATVKIDASEALDGCEGEVESIEVWHMEETENGTDPVLVAAVRDSNEAADGVAEFTVDSFSQFEFHYTRENGGGWAGFGANLIDEKGKEIQAKVSGSYAFDTAGRYDASVEMPYTLTIKEFSADFTSTEGHSYEFRYATVTNPNYGDTEHTFDKWDDEEEVGANELYGSEENPVVSVTIYGTEATENPNYGSGSETINSRTWHFTLTYADDTSVTIPIYGNADGAEDGGGKYCPKYLEINLYFKEGFEAVLNLGNGNGSYSDGDYTGSSSSGGSALRYSTGALNDYADGGKVTINLPSDNDLDTEFTVVDAVGTEGEEGYQPAVTIELGREQAYDYKLVGWINIATGEYYDVSDGSEPAEIDLSKDNVFYADWIGADYDKGKSTDDGLRDDTVSTKDFVTFRLFDYNELFDLYSVTLTQNGTATEEWRDSGYMYSQPILSSETPSDAIGNSFIFQNNGTTNSDWYVLSHANPKRWNLWTSNTVWSSYPEYNFVLDAGTYWNVTSPDSTILGMLYPSDEEIENGETSLGVHYVGEGDNLFWIDENGYYTYDSAESGAAYNQSEERFYVYNDPKNAFFPYNEHTDDRTSTNGLTDYWFGMNMEVQLYIPTATYLYESASDAATVPYAETASDENKINQVNGNDMIFDFSGDDDIMIFVDDKLVVDMSGIHSTSYSRINFSTNTVTYSMSLDGAGAPNISGQYSSTAELNLDSGYHTLKVFYMERGASASNLKIQFNVAPSWKYETAVVNTMSAEKVWTDSEGTVIDPKNLPTEYSKGIDVGLFDALSEKNDEKGIFGYTKAPDDQGRNTYTVEYTDDEDNGGIKHTYVYKDTDGKGDTNPTLTYSEGNGQPVTYSLTNSEGRVVDNDGYVVAWLEDETLHIRIDQQTLNNSNGWSYTWEMLDPDGGYALLELSSGDYRTDTGNENIITHQYWSVLGDDEIEDELFQHMEKEYPVILTDAAEQGQSRLGDTKEAKGWVIVAEKDGTVSSKEAVFSQNATLRTESDSNGLAVGYNGTYGVTSQSEIDSLGPGAVWYTEDSGHKDGGSENSGQQFEGFYLYCLIDGEKYYMALSEVENALVVTADKSNKAEFYYNLLGELRVVTIDEESENESNAKDRVVINVNDGGVSFDFAELGADTNDVRFYTLSDIETKGYAFTATNIISPWKDVDTDEDGVYGDDGRQINVGDELTYKIVFENAYPETANITITDTLDSGLTFVESSADAYYIETSGNAVKYDNSQVTVTEPSEENNFTLTVEINNVAPNTSGHVTFKAKVNENASTANGVDNQATVKVGNHSMDTNKVTNPEDTDNGSGGKEPTTKKDVDIHGNSSYGDNGKNVSYGTTLTYKIEFENPDDKSAMITITDVLDKGLNYVADSAKAYIYDGDGNEKNIPFTGGYEYANKKRTVTWIIEDVNAGASGYVTFQAKVNSTGRSNRHVDNTANVQVGDHSAKETNTVSNPIPSSTSSSSGGSSGGSGGGIRPGTEGGPGADITDDSSGSDSSGNSINTDSIGVLPKTGENNTAAILMGLCAIFVVLLGGLFYMRRRTPDNNGQ